jgi:hypothetical protein
MSEAQSTTDHEEIKTWIEHRKGRPAIVKETAGKSNSGILRVDFQAPDEGLKTVPWKDFFDIFDKNKLAFLHQDKTADGKLSRFHKFVER